MRALLAFVSVLAVVAACTSSPASNTGATGASTSASTSTTAASSTSASASASSGGGSGGTGGGPFKPTCTVSDAPYTAPVIAAASCSTPAPAGAPTPPAPKAFSGGTCPKLMAGSNTIMSTGHARSFLLAVPSNLQQNEELPIIFLWYWLKGSAQDFYTIGDVQNAVDQQRFVAVIPNAKSDLFYNWPFTTNDAQARVDEELAFFDDMLSCVSAQFNVNPSCVSSVGVSAGALWTDQLVGARSEYLASFVSLSGGVAYPTPTVLLRPWVEPTHHVPAIVLWGGAMDDCLLIEFQPASQALELALEKDCDFIVECVHNCGHSEPPFTAAQGSSTYGALWSFALDHPYWLPTGTSPYTTHGLPPGMPSWCAIGVGNAVPRTGACSGSGC